MIKVQNNIMLVEKSTISEPNLNNSYISQNNNIFFQNKIDFFSPLVNIQQSSQKEDESIFLEEPRQIMDKSLIGNTISDINNEGSYEFLYYIKHPKIEFKHLFNISKNMSSIEDNNTSSDIKEDYTKKIVNFKTVLHHKRGRKNIKKPDNKYYNKCHGSADFDNVQRKIQVSFITFLIRLANDAIKTVLGKKCKFFFKDIKYEFKKVVSHKYVEYLKQCKYSDIIQMKISSKNKNYGENLNKETLSKICKISPELQKLFEKNYLYIFQKYYCALEINQDIIDFDGLKIELSPLTKGILNLLRKNEYGKNTFNDVIQSVYFSELNYSNDTNDKNSFKLNPFIITSSEK